MKILKIFLLVCCGGDLFFFVGRHSVPKGFQRTCTKGLLCAQYVLERVTDDRTERFRKVLQKFTKASLQGEHSGIISRVQILFFTKSPKCEIF